jgi:hypothetical protein
MRRTAGTVGIYVLLLVSPGSGAQADDSTAVQIKQTPPGHVYFPTNAAAIETLTTYTVECWFKRAAKATFGPESNQGQQSTGLRTGGVNLDTIISRGGGCPAGHHPTLLGLECPEGVQFVLGIEDYVVDGTTFAYLVTDFRDGTDASKARNYALHGKTKIQLNTWYHAAVTYSRATGLHSLYLNGEIEAQSYETSWTDGLHAAVPVTSITSGDILNSYTALGAMQRDDGSIIRRGRFIGFIDEVRIWSAARSLSDIREGANARFVAPRPILMARWAFDNPANRLEDTSGHAIHGEDSTSTLFFAPSTGAPFNIGPPPGALSNPSPVGSATVTASWPDSGLVQTNLSVTAASGTSMVEFYLREIEPLQGGPADPGFSIVGVPDTQCYNNSAPATCSPPSCNMGVPTSVDTLWKEDMADWISENVSSSRRVRFVAHVGDMVMNSNADAAELGGFQDRRAEVLQPGPLWASCRKQRPGRLHSQRKRFTRANSFVQYLLPGQRMGEPPVVGTRAVVARCTSDRRA